MGGLVRPRLLDLFAGAGGAAVGYARAGFDVVGVDIIPQPRYPFTFIRADALNLDDVGLFIDAFDAIHASPPCQHWTAYKRRTDHVAESPDLIAPVRDLLKAAGLPYVIENVKDAPIAGIVKLCGSSFGLDVRRHRYFETSFPMLAPPCDHSWQTPRFPPATNRQNLRCTVEVGAWRTAHLSPAAMGVDWMTNEELSEAIPPAYTEFIGEQLIHALEVSHA